MFFLFHRQEFAQQQALLASDTSQQFGIGTGVKFPAHTWDKNGHEIHHWDEEGHPILGFQKDDHGDLLCDSKGDPLPIFGEAPEDADGWPILGLDEDGRPIIYAVPK